MQINENKNVVLLTVSVNASDFKEYIFYFIFSHYLIWIELDAQKKNLSEFQNFTRVESRLHHI